MGFGRHLLLRLYNHVVCSIARSVAIPQVPSHALQPEHNPVVLKIYVTYHF